MSGQEYPENSYENDNHNEVNRNKTRSYKKKGNGNLNEADAKLFETIWYGFRNPSKMVIARLV